MLEYGKITENISFLISSLLGVFFGVNKFWKSHKKTKNFFTIQNDIHAFLAELRVKTNSMRTSVFQFHNGGYFADGISMHKFSVSHESHHKIYSSQNHRLHNVLCSLYSPLITEIIQNKAKIISVDKLPEHTEPRHFFDDECISHIACLPLKSGYMISGFLLIQWHKNYDPDLRKEKTYMEEFLNIKNSIEIKLSEQKN